MFNLNSEKLTVLKWFDIVILSLILFGEGIFNSTLQYLALQDQTRTLQENLTFSALDNCKAVAIQIVWLALALFYLLLRNFDFSQWKKRILFTPWVPLQTIVIFIVAALCMDVFQLVSHQVITPATPSMFHLVDKASYSLIFYALLNGFYEEIFFLGICLMGNPKHAKWAFLYSLIIRCSFHTYQGLVSGIGLGLIVGIIFHLLYQKIKPQNMLPFFLAHAIADIIGLTVLGHIYI